MGSVRYAWLRSPNPSNANNERIVNTDGSVNNNNAYNSNGVAPDCENSPYQVVERPKLCNSHKEQPSHLQKEGMFRATKVPCGAVLLYALDFILCIKM